MRKLNILLISLFCLFATSCDDFLDVKPVGKVIPTTQDDFRAVLVHSYKVVPEDRRLSSIRGDELNLKKDNYEDYLEYLNQFSWQDVELESKDKQYPWQNFYKSILGTNQVIFDGVDAKESKKEELSQLIGEAYLLRAYMHLGLVTLYGDSYSTSNLEGKAIPLSIKIDIFQNYDRNTLGEVYTQIKEDVIKGIGMLNVEKQEKGKNYAFSKESAYGLAARLALYMGEWDNVIDYTAKALAINSSLEDMNIADSKLPIEYDSKENVLAMERISNGTFNRRFYISTKLESLFDDKVNDLRFGKFFAGDTEGERKFNIGTDLKYKCSMRTAEFYLMIAEAKAKSTTKYDLNGAKQYLKDLLVTRFEPAYYAVQVASIDAMNKDEFIIKVAEERMKELACQGFRWADLKRYGKPVITKVFDGKTYTLQVNDPKYIIPFPLEAVANNPRLKQ